jgi:riboflavin synthase
VFTGIIEETGRVKALHRGAKSFTLEVEASLVTEGTQVGDSIATNGVCLTVTSLTGHGFTADVMPETVSRTALGELKPGSPVNLERALSLQSRLGGHIVSGHVDGVGRISDRRQDDTALWITVECDSRLLRYIVEKGSITVQGVSLTVARVDSHSFAVSLIPHTQHATTLHQARVGDAVNLENDIIAKYVEKLSGAAPSEEGLMDKLRKYGF